MQTEPDTGRPAPGLDDRDATSPDGNSRHPVAHLAAGCLAGAAIIHFAMVPQHAGDSLLDPIGFAVAGWAQLWLAAALLRRDARDSTHGIAIVVNLALIGVWLWSRTSGLPWGAHAGVAEEIGAVDLIAVALQTVAVLASIAVLGTSAPVRRSSALTPLIGGVAALGLATAAIVSPDAASHGHTGETAVAAGGHAHGANGTDANHAGEMQLVDDTRCDQGFNPAAYWNEARTLGVDIYGGGAMAAQTTDESVMSAVAAPDPLGGRGSAGLDELIGATDGAGTSEISAAGLEPGSRGCAPRTPPAAIRTERPPRRPLHRAMTTPDTGATSDRNHGRPWSIRANARRSRRSFGSLATRPSSTRRSRTPRPPDGGW